MLTEFAHLFTRIDAHILLGDEPLGWRMAALADIKATARLVPLHLYQLPAQPGRFGGARKAGWAEGQAPYLTWFDPDDRYPPEQAASFLLQAASALDAAPSLAVVFSTEQQITATGRLLNIPCTPTPDLSSIRRRPSALHGLQLWRRSVVQALAPALQDTDPVAEWSLLLATLDAGHAYLRLPHSARQWRRHAAQFSKTVMIKNT